MKTKIIRIATVEFSTDVIGANIPRLIKKVKNNPERYNWKQEIIGGECWSGEWIEDEHNKLEKDTI